MKIFITGHKGFIGSHLFEHLSKTHTCIGFDKKDGPEFNIASGSAFPRCDLIIHLAGYADVKESHQSPVTYWINNVEASKRLFKYAEKESIKILYASSSSVTEWWTSPYAMTKKVIEEFAPKNSIGMRFTTVYAKDSRETMFYRKLIDNTAEYYSQHYRDYIHVDDIVSAIDVLTLSSFNGILDIGTGNAIRISELAEASGRQLPFKHVYNEQNMSKANIEELVKMGWRPTRNVLEDIKNDII